jgi:protocatechuate 3,4-dioxygenase beta subunit
MRRMMGICLWIVAGTWIPTTSAMTITGQVVDNKARPVQGAEVVVCEKYRIGFFSEDARTISPVVRTDAEGRFALDVGVTSQRDAFLVARKAGLAHTWEWLNGTLSTRDRKHFPLVLEPPCVLAGQVVDADGKPVAKAEVQATPAALWGFNGGESWALPGPQAWFAVTTDAQGRFRFEQFAADVSAGLRVRAPGGESRYVFHLHGSDFLGFQVGEADIRVVLPREGTIRGRTVDGQGRPVGGVDLMIRSDRERKDAPHPFIARTTRSEATGAFVFAGVPEGLHWVGVPVPEQGPHLWTTVESKVSVKAGGVTDVTIRVSKGGILEVTALDVRTRRPLAGAQLHVGSPQGHYGDSATTDATGVARVQLPPETYEVHVRAGMLSACKSTEKITDGQTIRRHALLTPPPRIAGRVFDPRGQPAVDVEAAVYPFGDRLYTDAQGKFEAGYDERYGTEGRLATARDVKRGLAAAISMSSSSRSVDLTLGPAWTLTGRVADPNGTGIPAARVSLHLEVHYCVSDTGVEILTDPQGRFEMKTVPRIPRGPEYNLSVNAAGYGPAKHLRIFPYGPAGASMELGTIRLSPAKASVSGIVVDARGVPAAGVPVFVNDPLEFDQPPKSTATNERGEFAIQRLCRGPACLQASFASSPGGSASLKTRLPARDVKMVLGKDFPPSPEASVVDTAPLQLTDLGSYLVHLQTDGRPILLCFIDIRQQSSRQCVAELTRKADALEAKGIITVALQASPEGTNELYAQLDAHCTAFPRRMVREDFEIRKAAWGIKSVPWLILTDKKHRAVAEGFRLDELDKRVEEALAR